MTDHPVDRPAVWWPGVVVTAVLSAGCAVVAALAFFLSAFCGDGGQQQLPACLTAFWGQTITAALPVLVPPVFVLWSRRDPARARRRLAICCLAYLLPVLWFLGLLRFWFH